MSAALRAKIFIYGPPGSGKSSLGRRLAQELRLSFVDLDETVTIQSGMAIVDIFNQEGEASFRERERALLEDVVNEGADVVALGGGALLDAHNRSLVESRGIVLCLTASEKKLLDRLSVDENERPLISENVPMRLKALLEDRVEHYASFQLKLNTTELPFESLIWRALVMLGMFHVTGMGEGYDVRVGMGGINHLGDALTLRGLHGPVVIVSDNNVAEYYLDQAINTLENSGYAVQSAVCPAGEEYKTIGTVETLWNVFLDAGLERRSTVVALGGGVMGDLAGFAAATYKRGVPWVVVPTSLLAMCDASLGGKTGADLPQGKNLIGAFHPPDLVFIDPATLGTLPEEELRNGMAEVVKHGIIGDPGLFEVCNLGWEALKDNWDEIIRRAIAVKVQVIQNDPYEKGERAVLNLGHTLGHAIEAVLNYKIRHGEAVSIGMVASARLAVRLGIAERGMEAIIRETLQGLRLPTEIPGGIDRERLRDVMMLDKKRASGKIQMIMPVRIGKVKWGIEIDDIGMLVDRRR
ncbi:MAG: 3-dehydroquinate synthase [Anaerolineales bacterium]